MNLVWILIILVILYFSFFRKDENFETAISYLMSNPKHIGYEARDRKYSHIDPYYLNQSEFMPMDYYSHAKSYLNPLYNLM